MRERMLRIEQRRKVGLVCQTLEESPSAMLGLFVSGVAGEDGRAIARGGRYKKKIYCWLGRSISSWSFCNNWARCSVESSRCNSSSASATMW